VSFSVVDWPNIYALLGVVGAVMAFAMFVVRAVMSHTFVTHREHHTVAGRVTDIEARMRGMATRADFTHLEGRLAPVELGVAVLGEQVKGVKDGVNRTEHMVSILLENELKRESKHEPV
jgi:hypothetical protein